jgi:hypothetical protein
MMGTNIIPTKKGVKPKLSVAAFTEPTRNSLIIAIPAIESVIMLSAFFMPQA